MERAHLSQGNISDCATKTSKILRAGGVVLYPTDTLYGLGVDAFSDEAVAKIYAIKGRDETKPIHAIVPDLQMANRYGIIDELVEKLTTKLPKGKITFIVRKRRTVTTGIGRDISTFGFRIPDNQFCIELLKAYGAPITATSANRAGEKPEASVTAILKQLRKNADNIDLIIDAGNPPAGGSDRASSVIDLSAEVPRIVREGAILAPEIETAIHAQV